MKARIAKKVWKYRRLFDYYLCGVDYDKLDYFKRAFRMNYDKHNRYSPNKCAMYLNRMYRRHKDTFKHHRHVWSKQIKLQYLRKSLEDDYRIAMYETCGSANLINKHFIKQYYAKRRTTAKKS